MKAFPGTKRDVLLSTFQRPDIYLELQQLWKEQTQREEAEASRSRGRMAARHACDHDRAFPAM